MLRTDYGLSLARRDTLPGGPIALALGFRGFQLSISRSKFPYFRDAPALEALAGSCIVVVMLVTGKISNTRGCCPVCGREVALTHAFNGLRLQESYGCYRCGPTTYRVAVLA